MKTPSRRPLLLLHFSVTTFLYCGTKLPSLRFQEEGVLGDSWCQFIPCEFWVFILQFSQNKNPVALGTDVDSGFFPNFKGRAGESWQGGRSQRRGPAHFCPPTSSAMAHSPKPLGPVPHGTSWGLFGDSAPPWGSHLSPKSFSNVSCHPQVHFPGTFS